MLGVYHMNPEEELQRYALIIENYKSQLESLENQFSIIQAAILEYTKAKLTLEKLSATDENVEILIPLGGGTFTYARTTDTSKILTDIGEGLLLEKEPSETIKILDRRIENLQQTQKTISKLSQRIQKELSELSIKAQKILSEREK